MENCIFCQIAQKKAPAHIIYEDEEHLAFLSIFPNTDGFSVVIPKKHYASYAFDVPSDVLHKLIDVSKSVGKKLDAAFEDVARTALVFEGFGVNHLHAKLIPLHGTNHKEWKPILSNKQEFYTQYQGHISTHDVKHTDHVKLATLAEKIRKTCDK
jgi:diadenosine tetraphosphate (Ap4A) HIT family hydrolase